MAKGKILAVVAALAMVSPVMAGGDAEAGKGKAASCAACHGPDGNSAAPTFPKIAGQHEDYTAKQLADFKSGSRVNALMAGQVAGLSDEDIADLSAYYATEKANIGKAKDETLAAGEAIYRGGIAETLYIQHTSSMRPHLRPRSQPILELANLEIPGDITHQAHSRSTTPVGTRRARRDVLIRSSSGERGTSL